MRQTRRTETKVGYSDPVVSPSGGSYSSTDKRYARDNRLISSESPHRRGGLAPRCRLNLSWGCSSSQGFVCSPIKKLRELGSDRRETDRLLSTTSVETLRVAVHSTRGLGWVCLWCTVCSVKGNDGYLSTYKITTESI